MSEHSPPQLLVDALAEWLADRAGLHFGSDIRTMRFDEGTAIGSCILSTGGVAGPYSPTRPWTFQILTRAGDAAAAMIRAVRLYDVIYPAPERLPVRNVTLSPTWLALMIDAIQPPADLGVSEGRFNQVSFNVQITAAQIGE
ncbi:MAG: hypothetical protein ABFD92_00050 [Planctomycetaceae bacterium]|nr:hypothetical protein [Planctomycetaceae bacterium]